jgi:hypothetical protein
MPSGRATARTFPSNWNNHGQDRTGDGADNSVMGGINRFHELPMEATYVRHRRLRRHA